MSMCTKDRSSLRPGTPTWSPRHTSRCVLRPWQIPAYYYTHNIHTHIHTYTHNIHNIRTHIHTYIHIHIHMHMHMQIHICICIHTRTHTGYEMSVLYKTLYY